MQQISQAACERASPDAHHRRRCGGQSQHSQQFSRRTPVLFPLHSVLQRQGIRSFVGGRNVTVFSGVPARRRPQTGQVMHCCSLFSAAQQVGNGPMLQEPASFKGRCLSCMDAKGGLLSIQLMFSPPHDQIVSGLRAQCPLRGARQCGSTHYFVKLFTRSRGDSQMLLSCSLGTTFMKGFPQED